MNENATKHEAAFVQSFIRRESQQRYLSKLASRKHRRRFLDRLNHKFQKDLDARFIVSGTRPWPIDINKCYMLADEVQYDGKLVTAEEAANAVSSAHFGIIVSFVPGRLACYKDELPSHLVWLERK